MRRATVEFTMETLAAFILVLIGAAILIALIYSMIYQGKIIPFTSSLRSSMQEIFTTGFM